MNYPYPKKAKIKYETSFLDGGTKRFIVLNKDEIGLDFVFQDFRLGSTSNGKFYTNYPGDIDSVEIINSFVEIE